MLQESEGKTDFSRGAQRTSGTGEPDQTEPK